MLYLCMYSITITSSEWQYYRNMHYRKDARLPEQLQRAMAAEAEASREARAKVIAADGEKRASKALREASSVIDESPSALQLRYLQVSHDDVVVHLPNLIQK